MAATAGTAIGKGAVYTGRDDCIGRGDEDGRINDTITGSGRDGSTNGGVMWGSILTLCAGERHPPASTQCALQQRVVQSLRRRLLHPAVRQTSSCLVTDICDENGGSGNANVFAGG